MKGDYNVIAELFLIIGGFILAETIIRWFLSLSDGMLPSWILPTLSILLIVTALDIKKYGILNSKAGLISAVFLGVSIILIVLMKRGYISPTIFLQSIFGWAMIIIIIQLLIIFLAFKGK